MKDKNGNNYNVEHIDPNELFEIQELLTYRSTWCKNNCIHVNAQLQIDVQSDINVKIIIENGKRNFNNDLSAEYMLRSNGDTIGMSIL